MRALKPVVFALMIAFLATPALAAAETGKPVAAAQKPVSRSYLSSAELDEIEAVPEADRAAFLKQKREAFHALSDEERAKKLKARSDAFDALPAAEQQTIKERTARLLGAQDITPPARDVAAEEAAAKQEADEFVKNLPPEQKAKWEEIRRNSKLWQDKNQQKK